MLEVIDSIIAFERRSQDKRLIVVAPRFFASTPKSGWFTSGEEWQDTRIELSGRFRNIITDSDVSANGDLWIKDVITDFPVAVLTSE